MKISEDALKRPTFWQLVFSQSKVNGAAYSDEDLHGNVWNWPQDTFLQRRLRQVRSDQAQERAGMS